MLYIFDQPTSFDNPHDTGTEGWKVKIASSATDHIIFEINRHSLMGLDSLCRRWANYRQQPIVERVAVEDAPNALGNDRADTVVD